MRRTRTDRRSALKSLSASAATLVGGPVWASAEPEPDVVIVGAGLSGLHTAMLLEEQGLSVQVIEG